MYLSINALIFYQNYIIYIDKKKQNNIPKKMRNIHFNSHWLNKLRNTKSNLIIIYDNWKQIK
jgi:hypothetical protein